MSHPDFSAVHLLPDEEAALRRYAALDQIPEDAPHLKTFQRLGFISKVDTRRDVYGVARGGQLIVSDEGRRFLNYLDEKKKERYATTRQFWITTGIAAAALIISLVDLILHIRGQ